MAVMKCDTMIDLMPDMWLSSQPQEDLDDDVDEYDRLVIDTSDPPQKSNAVMENETCDSKNENDYAQTELRGDTATSNTEPHIPTTVEETKKPTEIKEMGLPLRMNREIPIKLLLKRSFQNSGNKPHNKRIKAYREEVEDKLNERKENKKELVINVNKPYEVKNQETTESREEINKPREETITTRNEANHIKSKLIPQSLVKESKLRKPSRNKNTKNKFVEQHNLQILAHQEHDSKIVSNINQGVTSYNDIKKVGAMDKRCVFNDNSMKNNTYSSQSEISNRLENNQDITCIVLDDSNDSISPQNIKLTKHHEIPKNHDTLDYYKELLSTSNRKTHQTKQQNKTPIEIYGDDHRITPPNFKMFTSISSEKEFIKEYTRRQQELSFYHNQFYNYLEKSYRDTNNVKTRTPQIRKDDRHIAPVVRTQSSHRSQFHQVGEYEPKQSLSVVPNEFLFRDRIQETEKCVKSKSQSTLYKHCDLNNSNQRLQDAAWMNYMEKQYHRSMRDTIPLTVNRNHLGMETLARATPEARFAVVMNVDRASHPELIKHITSKQNVTSFKKKDAREETPVKAPNSPSPEKNPDYNILVQKGDINRIVITIASGNENEDGKHKTSQSPFGDQRVPESIKSPHSEANRSQRKRSYYYKEPSLRSFRKRLPKQISPQKQIRNSIEDTRLESPDNAIDYSNEVYAQHYAYMNQCELPTPVIEKYHNLAPPYYYNSPNQGIPLEVYDKRTDLEGTSRGPSRRSSGTMGSVCSSPSYVDHEQQMRFSPLNLSLKPLNVDGSALPSTEYTECYTRIPTPVHDYC